MVVSGGSIVSWTPAAWGFDHMKIAVYAIAKNEEKHLARWQEVCKEADHVVLLDTGSTDNTVSAARELGLTVTGGGAAL